MAAREVARVKSLRIRLLLAAEAAHGQIFEKIDREHRAEAIAAASGQSPTGPSSPWPALMTLNGAARTYAGLPLAHSKLAVRTAVGCDGNGEQTIGKHADACIESLCLPACRRWRAALRGGCFTGLSPLCLGLSGPAVSVSGSCPVETSIAHCVIQSCEVRAVAVGPLTPCTRLCRHVTDWTQ